MTYLNGGPPNDRSASIGTRPPSHHNDRSAAWEDVRDGPLPKRRATRLELPAEL
jgi:hypothetical protein